MPRWLARSRAASRSAVRLPLGDGSLYLKEIPIEVFYEREDLVTLGHLQYLTAGLLTFLNKAVFVFNLDTIVAHVSPSSVEALQVRMDKQLKLAVLILVINHGQVRLHPEKGLRRFAGKGFGFCSFKAQQLTVKQIGIPKGNGAES
jgi:hypothetical protein